MLIWFDAVSILSGSSFDIYIHILISFLSIGYFDFETLQKKKRKERKMKIKEEEQTAHLIWEKESINNR